MEREVRKYVVDFNTLNLDFQDQERIAIAILVLDFPFYVLF